MGSNTTVVKGSLIVCSECGIWERVTIHHLRLSPSIFAICKNRLADIW